MDKLSLNWVTEHRIDFEYKKYLLLAYLQKVEAFYKQNKLYPVLTDLYRQHESLTKLKTEKMRTEGGFPKKLLGADLKNLRLNYVPLEASEDTLEEVDRIVEYAIPLVDAHLEQGKALYDEAGQHIHIQPVGIVPFYKDEGYLLMQTILPAYVHVYTYATSVFEAASEKYRALKVHYMRSFRVTPAQTLPAFKYNLIQQNKMLPNPAAFAVVADAVLPMRETLLPIARRMLVREIAR
jgi:hypothetical protein